MSRVVRSHNQTDHTVQHSWTHALIQTGHNAEILRKPMSLQHCGIVIAWLRSALLNKNCGAMPHIVSTIGVF